MSKEESIRGVTAHYERDEDGKWWVVGESGRLLHPYSTSMEMAYQKGIRDSKSLEELRRRIK